MSFGHIVHIAAHLTWILCLAGCEVQIGEPQKNQPPACPDGQCPRVVEVPAANIPLLLRTKNYAGGSCVHASTETDFKWSGEDELAVMWRAKYAGGESYSGLTSKLRANQVPFYATHDGDVAALERCTRERRSATIFYFTNHSINFVGFHDGYAYLLDNNAVGHFIQVERNRFIDLWRGWGGVAVVPVAGAPPAPIPYL